MDITNSLNKAITAHSVMQQQAGNRFIVSIAVQRDGYLTRKTTHYKDYQEMLQDFDKQVLLYGEKNVSWSSTQAEALLATKII